MPPKKTNGKSWRKKCRANLNSGGLFKQSQANEELQARVRTMENRLDKAMVRYKTNLAKLADLRHQIDEMRKDRANFREVMRNAGIQQERKNAEIARLISESNDAYAERDRKKMKPARLQEAEKEDVKNHQKSMALLNATIENQRIAQNRPIE
jgi:chromosome segregation ATPase